MSHSNHRPSPASPHGATIDAGAVRALLEEFISVEKIPGMSLAVASPDAVLFADGVGHADLTDGRAATAADQYPWFSMTKIATATAATRLSVDGVLDLDAPIGDYLPHYRGHQRHGHPTTRQLLTHTAGLRNPLPIRWVRPADQPQDRAQHTRIINAHGTPVRPVGGPATYSNIGYLLAADVIEAATGQPIETCVSHTVLQPLGMTQTSYEYAHEAPHSVGYARIPAVAVPLLHLALPRGVVGDRVHGHTSLKPFLVNGAGYGGLIGSVTDAAKLAAAHASSPEDAQTLLPHQQIARMRRITHTGKPRDHGVGWFRNPLDADRSPGFVEHYGTGCGYWNAMRVYPDQRLAIVAMTNTTFSWDVDALFTRISDLSWH